MGNIGTKGKNALAPNTLNILPKFELAPMRTYFRIFTNTNITSIISEKIIKISSEHLQDTNIILSE